MCKVNITVDCCCKKDFVDELNGTTVVGTFADSGEARMGDVALSNGYAIWNTANSNTEQYLSWMAQEANGIITVDGIKLNGDGAWSFKFAFNLVGAYGTSNGWGIRIEPGVEMSVFEIQDNGGVEDPKTFAPATELSNDATLKIVVNKDNIEAYLSANGWNNVYNVTYSTPNRTNKGATGIGAQLVGYNGGDNGTMGKVTMQYKNLLCC